MTGSQPVDERCILDTMRFLDLIVTLINEGRQVLLKPSTTQTTVNNQSSSKPKPTAPFPVPSVAIKSGSVSQHLELDRLHRQLIEWIRIKDTESFVDALEAWHSQNATASEEINILNYMDDVGQTLLNWSAAFGTAEMCEYLCARGADVNRGARSSSLHYAACFGRAAIVKLLLAHGANTDLRDEEGKTALDKARERSATSTSDEVHRECVQILLQAPSTVSPPPMAAQTTVTPVVKADAVADEHPLHLLQLEDEEEDEGDEVEDEDKEGGQVLTAAASAKSIEAVAATRALNSSKQMI